MSRARPALPAPTRARVARVPDATLERVELARATWARHDHMWFFSSRSDQGDDGSRFDLRRPHGTCYFATDPVSALIEKLADPDDEEPLVSTTVLERLVVWSGAMPLEITVADVIARAARVTLEIGTLTPYDEGPWQWADALHDDGRGGIMWRLRFDPQDGVGVAVFGPASTAPGDCPDPAAWPDLADRGPATQWLEPLGAAFDIVEDVPAAGDLDIVDPGLHHPAPGGGQGASGTQGRNSR